MKILNTLSSVFEYPEKCMLLLFTKTAFVISLHPVKFLVTYLVLCLGVIGASYLFFETQWVDVYSSYRPKQFTKHQALTDAITRKWAEYQNRSSDIRWDRVNILFYDMHLGSREQKRQVIEAIDQVCNFVQQFQVSSDGQLLTWEKVRFSARSDGNLDESPRMCQLATQFLNLSDPTTQQFVLDNMRDIISSEELAKQTGQDVDVSSDYLPLLPLSFPVQRSTMSSHWQLALFKGLRHYRDEVRKDTGVSFAFSLSAYSRGEETRGIMAELPKLGVCIALLVISTIAICLNCGNWACSRALLAFGAVFMSLLSVVLGLAIGNMLQIPYMTLLSFVPFLILGIGIDSAFLFMQQWLINVQHGKCKTHSDLVVSTVEGCFLSVTLSDFTAIAAFAVGCTTPFLAVRICCTYLALCVVTLWLTELLFFLPCLAIKSRNYLNQERNRDQDLLPIRLDLDETTISNNSSVCSKTDSVFNCYEMALIKVSTFLTSKEVFRAALILFFAVSTGFNSYHLATMRVEENNLKYYMDDSIIREYYYIIQKYSVIEDMQLDVMVKAPYASSRNDWLNITADSQFLGRLKLLNKTMVDFKVFEKLQWVACLENLTLRNRALQSSPESKEVAVRRYSADVRDLADSCVNRVQYAIDTSNVHLESTDIQIFRLKYVKMITKRLRAQPGDWDTQVSLIEKIETLEKQFSDLQLLLFDWDIVLMWRDYMMFHSLWFSVAMAGGCCLLMVTLFIPRPLLIATTLLMTGITFVNIMGTLSFIGLTYCPQTYVVSLIAMGMSIDYIAHSGRCFFSTHRALHPRSSHLSILQQTLTEISVLQVSIDPSSGYPRTTFEPDIQLENLSGKWYHYKTNRNNSGKHRNNCQTDTYSLMQLHQGAIILRVENLTSIEDGRHHVTVAVGNQSSSKQESFYSFDLKSLDSKSHSKPGTKLAILYLDDQIVLTYTFEAAAGSKRHKDVRLLSRDLNPDPDLVRHVEKVLKTFDSDVQLKLENQTCNASKLHISSLSVGGEKATMAYHRFLVCLSRAYDIFDYHSCLFSYQTGRFQ